MVVSVIEQGGPGWIGQLLADRLGPQYRRYAEDAWLRMSLDPERSATEAGLFRVRLDDLLAYHPEMKAEVAFVIDEAARFLG
jgi:hypothetical protein